MENAITAGLSKQIILARALEVTANNIANQTTAGYKSERIAFREYLAQVPVNNAEANIKDPTVSLVFDSDSYTDFSAGSVEPTYNNLDFAIDGDGFFAVETANGTQYTRDGHFSVSEFGELVTRDGAPVLDISGSPIILDPEAGAPILTPDGVLQQQGAAIADLGVFQFDDNRSLRKSGDNLFAATQEATARQSPRIRQGFIESSNVESITAVTNMIEIMRSYQQVAQVIQTSDELARNAISTLSERA